MQFSKLFLKLNVLSKNLSRHLLVYWCDQPYVLDSSGLNFTQAGQSVLPELAKVVILARRHYQEFLKTYPVTDVAELKAVLAQEYADFRWVIHQYDRSESHQIKVCTFVLDAELIANCPGWVFFPETMLLANANHYDSDSNKIWDCAELRGFFFYCSNGLPVSQKVGPLCSNSDMFTMSNGLPDSLQVVTLSDVAFNRYLIKGLGYCLSKGNSFGCWAIERQGLSAINWRKLAILSSGALTVYLLLVSVYMALSIEWRKSEIAELGSGVNQLLDSQHKQQQIADSYNSLIASKANAKPQAQLWVLLQSMLADQVSLNSFSIENEKLLFRGSAARATDVLAKLLESPYVRAAEFSAPVRNDNGTEVFAISVTLNDSAPSKRNEAETNGAN